MEKFQDAKGTGRLASILAISTATPENCFHQADYPEYYFRVTNSQHMTELKDKFNRMCEKSAIKKRYMHLSEDLLKERPAMCAYDAPSLDARQDILVPEIPKLGKQVAMKAIEAWGQPKSKITHLIFNSSSGADMPGADYQLIELLGLQPSVQRLMVYHQGCYIGGTLLRIAKDFAENNAGSRVLVVSCEITTPYTFRGPSADNLGSLVGQAIAGDGAAALIIGAYPDVQVERPLFQIVSAQQKTIPDTSDAIQGHLREMGLTMHVSKNVASLVSENVGKCLEKAFGPLGISDWNSLFWVVHAGGAPILDQIEAKVGLKPEKLSATRHVLSEYGNSGGTTVFFALDHTRRKSMEEKKATTGLGLEWGVLLAFGAGLTLETVVLRGLPTLQAQ